MDHSPKLYFNLLTNPLYQRPSGKEIPAGILGKSQQEPETAQHSAGISARSGKFSGNSSMSDQELGMDPNSARISGKTSKN